MTEKRRISAPVRPADVPDLLARCRAVAGLSCRQAAAEMGQTSPNAFRRYEIGERVPDLAMLERLLDAVGYRLEIRAKKKKSESR